MHFIHDGISRVSNKHSYCEDDHLNIRHNEEFFFEMLATSTFSLTSGGGGGILFLTTHSRTHITALFTSHRRQCSDGWIGQ